MKEAKGWKRWAARLAGAAALAAGHAMLSASMARAHETNGGETVQARQEEPRTPPTVKHPDVEVVFVLDTTGSMGGLLEGAKQKIWSIANEIAKGRPAPRIKMGLVAYRDKGDEYVTRVFDLTSNLDRTYKDLLSLNAAGGGDEPEHVLKGLEDAFEHISWSKDPKTFKVVYLVGDAPPHEDYGDTPGLEALLRSAVRKGLIVNAIQCGSSPSTSAVWRKVARLGEGKFLAIPHDGGVVATATPYDERIAALSDKLERTTLAYGARRAEVREKLALSGTVAAMAAPAAAAERGMFKSRAGFEPADDLAEAVAEHKVDAEKLKDEELPSELRGLTPEARKAKLEATLAERRGIQSELDSLAARRARFLADASRKTTKADSFDAALVASLKEQASRKGIAY